VVWFGEALDEKILNQAEQEMSKCDLCLLVSDTASSVQVPAKNF